MSFSAVMAVDDIGGIGKDGTLPWPHLYYDMKNFREITIGGFVLMGRNTWDSISLLHKPLRGRVNIIMTRNTDFLPKPISPRPDTKVVVVHCLKDVMEVVRDNHCYVVGGEQIYNLMWPFINRIYLTHVEGDWKCDTHAPLINIKSWRKSDSQPEQPTHHHLSINYHFYIIERF